jgi:hypothetical protein
VLRIGPSLLAAGLILTGMGAGAPAQEGGVPNFGTTVVVPGGLRGVIYPVPPQSRFLPLLQWLRPVGVIYTPVLNVPPRNYREGFPGVAGRLEWFAIDYSGRFWIEEPGTYRFELTSDDGAKLYIDDQLVINNDGIHPPQTRLGEWTLTGGIHRIEVPYYQGPGYLLALVLRIAGPGQALRVFSTEEFKPPPDPAAWLYQGQVLHVSSATGSPGEKLKLEISVDSAMAEALTGFQWEMVFPAQLLELDSEGPEAGSAAVDAGKSITCAQRKPYSYSCTLLGGKNPVANGLIAIFHFKIRTTAEAGTSAVRIEKAGAVTVDSKKLALNNAEGTVTIQPTLRPH